MVHLLLVYLAALNCNEAIYFLIYVEHILLNKPNNGMPQLTTKKHYLKGLRENDSKSKASSLYHLWSRSITQRESSVDQASS